MKHGFYKFFLGGKARARVEGREIILTVYKDDELMLEELKNEINNNEVEFMIFERYDIEVKDSWSEFKKNGRATGNAPA